MKNIAGLMKQAQQMQDKMAEMQSRLEAMELDGESGAGMVRVTLTGKGEMKRIKIDPKMADPADTERGYVITFSTATRRASWKRRRRPRCRRSAAACNCRRASSCRSDAHTVMAGEGRPPTTFLDRAERSRGWPAFAGHDELALY